VIWGQCLSKGKPGGLCEPGGKKEWKKQWKKLEAVLEKLGFCNKKGRQEWQENPSRGGGKNLRKTVRIALTKFFFPSLGGHQTKKKKSTSVFWRFCARKRGENTHKKNPPISKGKWNRQKYDSGETFPSKKRNTHNLFY